MDFEKKLTDLNDGIDGLVGRMADMERELVKTMAPGPGLAPSSQPAGFSSRETKAFGVMLRKGVTALEPTERKVLLISDNPAAGYLAPPQVSAEIIRVALSYSPLRQICRVVQINRESLEVPKRSGHGDAAWVGETEVRAETLGLKFSLERLTPYEMFYLVKVSLKMLEDAAYPLEQEIAAEIGEQCAVLEGAGFISGTGAQRPEGILTNTSVAHVPSGAAAAITADAIQGMPYELKGEYARNGFWVMNRRTLGAIRKLKDPTSGDYLWQPGLIGGQPNLLCGYPVLECSDMPDVAAAAEPVAFGDFRRGYMIVDRVGIAIQRLAETYAVDGIVGFLARKRVGGQVVDPGAFIKMRVEES